MTTFQKIIKYGAIAFAIYLCLMIISMTIFGITALLGVTVAVDQSENNNNTVVVTKWEEEYDNINRIDIDLSICKLFIKKGEKLKVEASEVSEQFICEAEGKQLKIADKRLNRNLWGMVDVTPEVIVYLPENIDLEEVIIETGVNETNIDYLKADKIKIEMGVGKYQMNQLIAKYAKIEAGAGEANIRDSQIEELKLDGGVGKLAITSKITAKADVSCGMGKVEINLVGLPTDYQVKAHTGLGNFEVEGQKVSDNQVIGNGKSNIKVDAGVGETIVNFVEDKI